MAFSGMESSSTTPPPCPTSAFIPKVTEIFTPVLETLPSNDSLLPSNQPQSAGNPSSLQTSFSEDSSPIIDEDFEDGEEYEDDELDLDDNEDFCIYMKNGGCEEPFVAWDECVEAAVMNGQNYITKCRGISTTLKKCLDSHGDYYEPILSALLEIQDADAMAEKVKKMSI